MRKFYKLRNKNTYFYCVTEDDKNHYITNMDFFTDKIIKKERIDLEKYEILAPIIPTKIVCIGLNYIDHAKEVNMKIPEEPLIFIKPSTAVIGPNEKIRLPESSNRVDYEAELAIVIKKKCYKVPEEQIDDYILGYTCLNDVTARDLQFKDQQWTRAKSFDTFAPIGPCIVQGINPDNLEIKLYQNNELKQHSNTNNFIFNHKQLVSFISNIMTLLPGDIISTGTPPGIGPMQKGDTITIEIENIGKLTNIVE